MTLLERYNARVDQGQLVADPAQLSTIQALDDLAKNIAGYKPKSKWLLSGVFGVAPPRPKGLYLYGGVGRGKSMLMDMFYDASPIRRKRRVHFHAFMQEIHEAMHEARQKGVEDAIRPVAEQVVAQSSLLCFDEMQITDITDAMIVGRLFERLFAAGVVVVTTSNRVPDDLYLNGLNRPLFLPFIALIKERMQVWELASDTDYRQNRLSGEQVYFSPADKAARDAIKSIWADLTQGQGAPLTLRVKGRDVVLPAFHNGVARAGFHDLCGQPLGPADYLAVAEAVRILILEDIPCLDRHNFNQAKRFVTLIDALYEAKVRLIATAAAAPEMLYLEGEGSFEFERTASRLREMQSADWGRET